MNTPEQAAAVTPDRLIRPEIRALSAYHVAPSDGMVKLDAMENPYHLPADLRAEVARVAADAPLNRYPDPTSARLKALLAREMNVPAGMALMLGNGSDEIIQILAQAVAAPGAVVLSVEPTFVMFRMIATFTGMSYAGVPLTADWQLDLPAMLAALERHRPALTFLAYPNNPTGNLFDARAMEAVIRAAPGLAVVDEAYFAFADESFLPRLPEFPNLVVMRTVSKLGLAGIRLGLLAGAPAWLQELDKLRLPYNINVLTQRVAEVVLSRGDVLHAQAAELRGGRARLLAALQAMPGVTAWPSAANFILFRAPRAASVYEALKQRGILIKNLSGGHPMLQECLRVTVGTAEEIERFVAALRDVL